MAQKSVLGKGLGSLLPGAGSTYTAPGKTENSEKDSPGLTKETPPVSADVVSPGKDRIPGISMTGIEQIIENPFQPRKEFDLEKIDDLSKSIEENGLIQPLVVRKTEKGYELIAGERRFRASKKAGLKQVPIVIRKTTDREMLELALIENIQREDLNCVEVAKAYFQLSQEFTLTQEQIAKKVGKDRASVANYLRLLRLPEEILESLKSDEISFGHGKALMSAEDREIKLKAFNKIKEEKLSVRATEDYVQELKDAALQANASLKQLASQGASTFGKISQRFRQLSRELTNSWSTRVQLKGNENKGKFVIHYGSREELDRLIDRLQEPSTPPQPPTMSV